MLSFIKHLFIPVSAPVDQNSLYIEVLDQAQLLAPQRFMQPSITPLQRYAKFEVIALLMAYLMWQAKENPATKDLTTLAMEAMFDDFDVNLREQGMSDIRVGPEVRKLAAAFNGRQQHYFEAFGAGQAAPLVHAIAHNWKITLPEAKALVKKLTNLKFSIASQHKVG